MDRDPIVEEVRKARREIEARCGNTWDGLFEHYRQLQRRLEEEGRFRLVSGSPKRLAKAPRRD